jgi:hypothetical protein
MLSAENEQYRENLGVSNISSNCLLSNLLNSLRNDFKQMMMMRLGFSSYVFLLVLLHLLLLLLLQQQQKLF